MMEDFRWREFIEDADGRGSAARLNMIVGVIIGSIVVLYMAFVDKLTEGIFGIYMLATGGVYGLGKWRESVVEQEQIKADAPANNKTISAEDVNIKAEGDVNVRPANPKS